MRIALDATYSADNHPSGIAVYSREVISGLARLYPQDDFLLCYRPKQFRLPPLDVFRTIPRRLLLPFPTFRADLFHALNQRVDRRPTAKVVSTFHDLFVMTGEYSTPEFRGRFTGQARRAAENSDLIIAVSEFTARQLSHLLGIDRARIRVVPHGVRAPIHSTSTPRDNIILFVGALQIRKNVERLVEAFEGLPKDWRLVLAGAQNGFGASRILERIERSSSRDRIRIAGYVSGAELERLYSTAAILAFPSLDEGFGIPVLEAMAHGLPVVTSNRSALAEVAGDAALLVNPEDAGQLEAALVRTIHDSDLRVRLIERGLGRASLYTWERTVRMTYEVYKELMG